jgi:hypothetical protein
MFDGRVGIGTTNPGALLELSGASQIDNSTPTKLRITSTTTGTTGTPIDTTKPYGLITFYTPDTSTAGKGDVAGIGGRFESTLGGDTALCFYTDGDNADDNEMSERMCINHDGNVGIGVTNPGGTLTLQQTSGSYASGTGLRFLKNGSTVGIWVLSATAMTILHLLIMGAQGVILDTTVVTPFKISLDSTEPLLRTFPSPKRVT